MEYEGIELGSLLDEEVLFFIRIRGKSSYFNMVYTQSFLDLFTSIERYRCISEYKKDADVHIDLNSIERDYLSEEEFEDFKKVVSLEEVISRCRGLRNISWTESKKLVNRTYLFFQRFFRSNPRLKLIVTGAIDNYVMDIMDRVGRAHGVKFLGVTDSFMSPEYKLITVRGEHNCINSVDESELQRVFKGIKNAPLSPLVPKRFKAWRSAFYDLGSYVYRFVSRYLLKYVIFGRLEYEYRFAPKLHKFYCMDQLLAIRSLKDRDELKLDSDKQYAYVPLHFYPEATTDYWMDSLYHVDYLTSLLDTIKKLKEMGYEVLVKEHPAYYLGRRSEFYKEVEKVGAILVTPFISTRDIFQMVDIITVWNGSTGIEAIVHNKPLVKVTNSYYGDGVVKDLRCAKEKPLPTERDGIAVVKRVLESSFRTVS